MPDDLKNQYSKRQPILEELRRLVQQETVDALAGLRHIDRIIYRVKGVDSFLAKATDPKNESFYTDPLAEIEDQIAGRVITFFLNDLPLVKTRLMNTYSTVEGWTRRPERDAEFGYESEHLILIIPPQVKPSGWDSHERMPTTFELQIRTIFMHAYAEPQHDIGYKGADDLPKEIRRELGWIAASAWGADHAYERVRQWSEQRQSNGASTDSKQT
jgi:putative GTP pyrophosphokinase